MASELERVDEASNTRLVEIALTWNSEKWPWLASVLAKELARRMCAEEDTRPARARAAESAWGLSENVRVLPAPTEERAKALVKAARPLVERVRPGRTPAVDPDEPNERQIPVWISVGEYRVLSTALAAFPEEDR